MRTLHLSPPDLLLPDNELIGRGPLTAIARFRGFATYRQAATAVWQLPYGRNTSKGDLRLVLLEGRGTCSTKHAFLRKLAEEQRLRVALVLAFYEMTEDNTPGVGRALEAHGVTSVLEAHCFLLYKGHMIDLTSPPGSRAGRAKRFLRRKLISAEQIGTHKEEQHKQALAEWIKTLPPPRPTEEEVWRIREACIAELSA